MTKMHRLILLRHSKAEPAIGHPHDHARVLTDRGREGAREAGEWLAHGAAKPDLVLCSTAARTRQTWEEVAPFLDPDVGVVFEERLYDADADMVLAVLGAVDEGVRELLVIGHNPSLEAISAVVIGDGHARAMPTSGIQIIEIEDGSWEEIGAGGRRGTLKALFRPTKPSAASE